MPRHPIDRPAPRSRPLLLATGLAVAACGSDAPAPIEPTGDVALLGDDCDPLVPSHCGLPFPSNVYLAAAAALPSGQRVTFGETTLPTVRRGGQIPRELLFDLDGFSPGVSPMTHMPGATATGLPTPEDIDRSLGDDSPTVLLDAETLERVPHFAELDGQTSADAQRALFLRPVVRLGSGRRYLVALRRIVDAEGTPLAPSPVFRALRDGRPHPHPSVVRRRALYDELFEILERAGVARDELQLAWDFSTATDENTMTDLVTMRDRALAIVGDDGPELEVKSVVEAPNERILRRIVVTMTVPLFLESAEWTPGDDSPAIHRDGDGLPSANGTMQWDVLIHVPRSVATAEPHGLLQNGHGLFGSAHEGENGYLAVLANDHHWIAFSTDLYGMNSDAVELAREGLTSRPELMRGFVARQQQGHVNQLLAMRMMRGRVARDGLRAADGALLLEPEWIDSRFRAYRGDSQGGIMGSVYMSLSTDVTRGLLGEAGFPFTFLLNRSVDWASYAVLLRSAFPNVLDTQIVLGLLQMAMTRSDGTGYTHHMASDPIDGTPSHAVLLHDGIGDHQVSTLATHILARTIGAVNLRSDDAAEPLVRDVWGLEGRDAPLHDVSALVEYDFGLSEPLGNVPPTEGCDPHDRVRSLEPSQDQEDLFFRTGEIRWFCDGVCSCDGARAEAGCEETFADECED